MEDLLIQISKDAANAKCSNLSQSATEAYGSIIYYFQSNYLVTYNLITIH